MPDPFLLRTVAAKHEIDVRTLAKKLADPTRKLKGAAVDARASRAVEEIRAASISNPSAPTRAA